MQHRKERKICSICNEEKDRVHFLNGKDRVQKKCKRCRNKIQREFRKNNIEKQRATDRKRYQSQKHRRVKYAKEYRIKYPERTRATNWMAKYKITPEQFWSKLDEQNGKCAICEREMDKYSKKIFCVDHNHETGQVRGLLCDPCNYGLGFYEKHKEKYEHYLKKHINPCP